jgi:hypothetical protein
MISPVQVSSSGDFHCNIHVDDMSSCYPCYPTAAVTLTSLPQIGTKRTFASRNHRNQDNASNVHNLSLILPPSNINLPMPNPFSSIFNFSFVNDSYLSACR